MNEEKLKELSQKELDELVMEELKKIAGIVNSLGREGQIQFLLTAENGSNEKQPAQSFNSGTEKLR